MASEVKKEVYILWICDIRNDVLLRFPSIYQSGHWVENRVKIYFQLPLKTITYLQICSCLFNFSNFLLLNFLCLTLTKPTHAHKWLTHRRQKEAKNDTASFQCSVSVLNVESHFIIYNNYYQAFFRSDEKKTHGFFLIKYLP